MNRCRRNSGLLALPILLLNCVLCSQVTYSQDSMTNQPTIVIEGATLIDGTGREPIADSVVVIVGNKIQTVGEKGQVSYPQGARVIQAAGKFVIPGLIDSHVHYHEWSGELFLAHGVTTVMDVGNSTEWMMAMKEVFRRGIVKMPRLFSTGVFLTAPMSVNRGFRGFPTGGTYREPVKDAEEARLYTRKLIQQKVDGIKILQNLLPDQLRAITEEAHKANLPVMGHVFDAEEAAELGVDRIEHTHGILNALIKKPENRALLGKSPLFPYYLIEPERFDSLIKLLVGKGIYYAPLLIWEHRGNTRRAKAFEGEVRALFDNPSLRYVPRDVQQVLTEIYRTEREVGPGGATAPVEAVPLARRHEFDEGFRKDQEFIRRFVNTGGKVLAGTDAGSLVPGLSLHQEMQLLADAGLTPMQVLAAATRNAAESLRKLDQVGTIEPGKLADLVVLKADPLTDIANTRQIDQVMLDGKFVDTRFHPDYKVPFAPPLFYGSGLSPIPRVTNITPRSATEGDDGVELTVEGEGFSYSAYVIFGEERLPTQFLGARRLRVIVPTALFGRPGTFFVKVHNPPPGGGRSNGYGFIVLYRPTLGSGY